jgi:hypothetical protein
VRCPWPISFEEAQTDWPKPLVYDSMNQKARPRGRASFDLESNVDGSQANAREPFLNSESARDASAMGAMECWFARRMTLRAAVSSEPRAKANCFF